jgi:hypothetical protein
VLGVVGDRARVDELTRWLIVQLATRRSPEDLSLVILCKEGGTPPELDALAATPGRRRRRRRCVPGRHHAGNP